MLKDLLDNIGKLLMDKKETVAVAESVTSGTIQTMLSLATNASVFFQGGITTYTLDSKVKVLHVDKEHAEKCDCVSEKVAAQMASEVCNLFASDYGISITGFASAIPEKELYDLFAFYAITHHGKVVCNGKLTTDIEDPKKAQEDYTEQLLRIFEGHLGSKNLV